MKWIKFSEQKPSKIGKYLVLYPHCWQSAYWTRNQKWISYQGSGHQDLIDPEYWAEVDTIEDNILFGDTAKDFKIEQLSINFNWILKYIDEIHRLICPDKNGTWQDRVLQVYSTIKAKKII